MSKEAKSGELEKEFRPPFDRLVGGVLPLPDGGMYLTGCLDAVDADNPIILLLARVDAEGNADVDFGVGGVASAQLYMGSSISVSMGAIQGSDGKVTAAAVVDRTIGLARFTPNGTLDTEFGESGTGTITHTLDRLSSGSSWAPSSEVSHAYGYGWESSDGMLGGVPRAVGAMHAGIVPAPGGGTYFTRNSGFGGPGWSYLVRFDARGKLDRTFAQDGIAYVQHPDYPETVTLTVSHVVSTDESGKVVVAGWVGDLNDQRAFVARFDKSGHLDPAFGDGGFAVVQPLRDPSSMRFNAVHATPDGRIFASGTVEENGRGAGLLMGLDAAGKPLLSFNQGEPVLFDLLDPDMESDFGANVAVQADGKIVVAGWALDSAARMGSVVAARYLPDGSLDRSFAAPQGWTTIDPFGRTDNWPLNAELASDGKIVIAGGSFDSTSGWVVRLSS